MVEVEANGRAAAAENTAPLPIGDFRIGPGHPAFLIAEIGINHNGRVDLARRLVDEAVRAGADCAKFQMRNMAALYRNAGNADDISEDLGSQYILDMLANAQLTPEEMFGVFDYCKEQGILPLCTPWDAQSLADLEDYGMPAYKVASADLTNHELLKTLAATGKPLIISTGMSTEEEIKESIALLRRLEARFCLLHCNSTYPAPFKHVNLAYMDRLAELAQSAVGYSGHERGYAVPIAAVARGARVIEKHLTLDRSMEGNDHKVSLLPDEFAAMVESIRQVEEAMGEGTERHLSQGERMNREMLSKSLVATRPIAEGTPITAEMLDAKSPGKGLQPNRREDLIGRPAPRDLAAGDFFFPSDLGEGGAAARDFRFHRPFGIPVRYHDYAALVGKSNVDFLEFHLSYKDMDQDAHEFFDAPMDLGYAVHSPDLFEGDHILNLAAEDDAYRQRSIRELQRAVDVTRALRPYFTQVAERVLLIASLGGFSRDAPLPEAERPRFYERVAESLAQIDQSGVEIIGQTLPPFPWYLGGQLYCNLFVDAEDTARFCEETGTRLCFDVSHSKLTCNHRGASFEAFADLVGPHTAHLHLVDAAGDDSEGLQIGEGEIDFERLAAQLKRHCPEAGFIPEIWQGHKNEGEGFWIALERLEPLF